MVIEPNSVSSIFMTPSFASLKGPLGKVCARSPALGRGEAGIGGVQGFDRAEHTFQAVARPAAPGTQLRLGSETCPTAHRGHELIVQLDHAVEETLARFHQVAGDQGVALGLGEAAQIAGIVAAAVVRQPWLAGDPTPHAMVAIRVALEPRLVEVRYCWRLGRRAHGSTSGPVIQGLT
jgi:hypothetical protein